MNGSGDIGVTGGQNNFDDNNTTNINDYEQPATISSSSDDPIPITPSPNHILNSRRIRNSKNFRNTPRFFQDAVVEMPSAQRENRRRIGLKGPVIGLLTLCTIVFLLIFGIQALSPKQQENSTSEKFYEFANYYIYGTDSQEPLTGEYEHKSTYWLAQLNHTEDEIADHFKQSEEKFKEFYESYEKLIEDNSDTISENAKNEIETLAEKMELFKFSYLYPILEEKQLEYAYISDDIDIQKTINGYYAPYDNAVSDAAKDDGLIKLKATLILIDAFDTYNQKGCVNPDEKTFEDYCFTEVSDYDFQMANESWQYYINTRNDLMIKYNQIKIEPYKSLWKISKELSDEEN